MPTRLSRTLEVRSPARPRRLRIFWKSRLVWAALRENTSRDSLLTLDRLVGFLGLVAGQRKSLKENRERIKTLTRDVRSLLDHAGFMAQKITFLLDATLGMINIEQNAIIKIFSVVAVVFLPPTLIASIYGMNFDFMPELDWQLGYPLAIALMLGSALAPYLFFKSRGWL